jgi:penicillin-binding protein 2
MRKKIAIKNHLQEIRLINQRSFSAFVVMILLVLILIARLGYLQLSQHDIYTTLSKKNWLDLVPLEPTRGLIYDRRGMLLAENVPVFSLDVIPYKVSNLPKMLADISRIVPLEDVDIAQFQKQLKQHRQFDEITLKLRLSETEVARFSENQYRFPGVIIKARLMRHYPLGENFSHVLGYVARINTDELKDIDTTNYSATNYIGKIGIEKFYEDELHGTVGYQQVENDASGEPVRVLNQTNPIPGKNLYLTIDSGLQLYAERLLNGYKGAIIAIQPKTGQVLAMVSEPSFDPNLFVAGISALDFKNLQQSPDRPLYNRALRGLYPFASTIKPFLALQGLNTGTITPDYTIFDPGWFKLKNSEHLFHDWRPHGHGSVSLLRAITGSCDTYFYELASRLGIKRIDDILLQFGFGNLTGIDLEEELPGNVASPEWKRRVKGAPWYPGDTVNSGIGQGYMQVTPLQLASGIASLSTRGKRYTPYLLMGDQEPGKNYSVQTPTPTDPVGIRDQEIWNRVIDAMHNVINSQEGTGYRFGRTPYTVAAKTGTAQVYTAQRTSDGRAINKGIPAQLRDHAMLVIFAPVEDPKIAVAIIVENGVVSLGAENHGPAVSIARQLLDYYLLPQNMASNQSQTTVSTGNGTSKIV